MSWPWHWSTHTLVFWTWVEVVCMSWFGVRTKR